MNRFTLIVAFLGAIASVDAFSTPFIGSSNAVLHRAAAGRTSTLNMAVDNIENETDFDQAVSSAENLVIVDYSTTWCGPCKVIAPKFDELSDKYTTAKFLKVIGDASPAASQLMKREGVRSVPSFHLFMNGERVDVVNGANAEAIEAAITKYV